jgi:hypothetical protein
MADEKVTKTKTVLKILPAPIADATFLKIIDDLEKARHEIYKSMAIPAGLLQSPTHESAEAVKTIHKDALNRRQRRNTGILAKGPIS